MKIYKNILLIAGEGRNVGKTTLACKIINKFSRNSDLVAVKISPHFHRNSGDEMVIHQSEDFICAEEINPGKNKDSSLMLKAGAGKVYYLQVNDDKLGQAFNYLWALIPEKKLVVCESGGLGEFITPGIFLMVRQLCCRVSDLKSNRFMDKTDRVVTNSGNGFDLNLNDIETNGYEWKIRQ